MASKGDVTLPKFGDWDPNNPSSAEGFTEIFAKAKIERRNGGQPDSPKSGSAYKPIEKPQSRKWLCCM